MNERQWKFILSALLIMLIISMVTGDDMFSRYDATKNGVFAVMCGCIWIGMFNSIQSICKEREYIKKEYKTGMHISSYVFGHVFYELVLCLLESVVVVAVVVVMNRHLPRAGLILIPSQVVFDMFISIFLVIFVSDLLALLISSLVREATMAMTIMPFVLIIQLVMSGAVFNLEGITETISDFTICKWGMKAMQVIANTTSGVKNSYFVPMTQDEINNMIQSGTLLLPPDKPYPLWQQVPQPKDMLATADNLANAWMYLALFGLVYIVISVIALKGVSRDKR